ncbi:hypothetical protein V5E97_04795 [Singulisphaera sp. Ch08]|uniref:Secreted protein n=1 Tax=Singulisphaera sp. Ch08 TaxID=3120278 RepID=A0AAU7CJ92_9BACT
MRLSACSALLFVLAIAGCGGPEAPLTDASKVPPLTAEQLETIRQDDLRTEQEEGGAFLKVKARYAARTKRRG